MRLIKLFLLGIVLSIVPALNSHAQLKKTANIEKVKSFTNGSVVLNKTTTDSVAVYSVTLRNNSRFMKISCSFLATRKT